MKRLEYWILRFAIPYRGVVAWGLLAYSFEILVAVDGAIDDNVFQAVLGFVVATFSIWMTGRYIRQERPGRNLGTAIPPEDVRIILQDDTDIPAELIYLGLRGGMHIWRTAQEYEHGSVKLCVARLLQPNILIQVAFRKPAED